ncbi:Ig-like domain-containing protein, partial [Robiginitalea sp.]|nr:Ig-like domain-containing protein [Robiginitalea sp.]
MIYVLLNDINVPNSGYLVVADSTLNGTVVVNANETAGNSSDDYILYTPNPDYSGSDEFRY